MVKAGYIDWPLSERKPPGFKDADVGNKRMMLQADDVWRLVQMTLILGPVMYISLKALIRHFHVGIILHNVIALMFFIDIVRRHTHPHCWYINFPVWLLWLCDKVAAHLWRRERPDVTRLALSGQLHDFTVEKQADDFWHWTKNIPFADGNALDRATPRIYRLSQPT